MSNFNPRSPRGERPDPADRPPDDPHFNPRSPRGERRCRTSLTRNPVAFQSTLPARGATPEQIGANLRLPISIHAPREGSDQQLRAAPSLDAYFNPRSPRGERRRCSDHRGRRSGFQSTLPARGATRLRRSVTGEDIFQSTLPARGATQFYTLLLSTLRNFNPRSPRGERRPDPRPPHCANHFNPRSPRGERQRDQHRQPIRRSISIHAPREGSDAIAQNIAFCGAAFQSTLPARGATSEPAPHEASGRISIHAPREGSD